MADGEDEPRLAAVVARQRHELARARADADAAVVVATARGTKRKLVVGYILRQHPSWIRFIEIARQQDEFGTEPARHDAGHGSVNAELAGFIRSGGNDAPFFTTYGYGLAPQTRIGRLLH